MRCSALAAASARSFSAAAPARACSAARRMAACSSPTRFRLPDPRARQQRLAGCEVRQLVRLASVAARSSAAALDHSSREGEPSAHP